MEIYRHSFLFALMVVFLSCKNNEKNIIREKKFIKEWISRKSIIPHTAYLKINPDHTFKYNDRGCQWETNAFGNWRLVNDTLILNSLPSKKCQFIDGFGNNMRIPNAGEDFKPETTIKGCEPEKRNGVYVNFIDDKFYIKNDTLEYVTNIKFPFNDRIAFFIKQ